MVYSIFTPHLLYWLKHVDASWNYSRRSSQLVGSDIAAYICVNIGIGGRGSSLNPIQASENIVILETNVCTSSVPT